VVAGMIMMRVFVVMKLSIEVVDAQTLAFSHHCA
jgi:hypothetical protein